MLQSMTAFSRQQIQNKFGLLCWEIRAVNHRYLEAHLHLPDCFHELEIKLRELLHQHIQRGKLVCHLTYKPVSDISRPLTLDESLLQQLQAALQQVTDALEIKGHTINPIEVIQWPGMLIAPQENASVLHELVISLFLQTLHEINQVRRQEGNQISHFLQQHIEKARLEIKKISDHLPDILYKQRERLQNRLAAAQLNLASERLEQEMLLFAHKLDVTEEVERLTIHLDELQRIIASEKGASGRRLDFLLQELNREANTLAAKSVDTITTYAAVELKVLFEQIREQVQNIE